VSPKEKAECYLQDQLLDDLIGRWPAGLRSREDDADTGAEGHIQECSRTQLNPIEGSARDRPGVTPRTQVLKSLDVT